MELNYRTLREIHADHADISYQRFQRAVKGLEDAGSIHPWRGVNNAIQVTLDDAARILRLVPFLRNRETVSNAVEQVIRELLQERIEQLEAENERLRSMQLVEVTPSTAARLVGWWRKWASYLTRRRA